MKRLLFLLAFASFFAFEATSQCGRVSLIGEFTNNWTEDLFLVRFAESPNDFHQIITVTEADDVDGNGTVEMKFRENADWTVNWGSDQFPTGTATEGGPNIPVPFGTWLVMFNCETGVYSFTSTCGTISMIGEFNEWAGDHVMMRMHGQAEMWYTTIFFDENDDQDGNDTIEAKFRENMDWTNNWGSDQFPSGTAVQDGPNIKIPLGGYLVTFNCQTGDFNFQSTCGDVSIIGELTGWADDIMMHRDMANPDEWSLLLTLTADDDPDGNDTVEMKFRQNMDWTVNWGSDEFPSGTAVQDGANIKVPLEDPAVGLTTDYYVTFNCATGAYNFHATSGQMNLIGEFNGWAADIPMYRDSENPDLWKVTRAFPAHLDVSPVDGKIEVKFRETNDWTANWGGDEFPSGTGVAGGNNIMMDPGTYDITFNYATKEYNFVSNAEACGEIGIIGVFNNYGGDPGSAPTDLYMVRDPMFPSRFTLEHNFSSSDLIWFRMDGDPLYNDIWGGNTFPNGVGVLGGDYLEVPGGKYVITFNCKSYEYSFERLGNAVTAPKVFTMNVDGILSETDWDISQPVAKLVEGSVAPEGDLNEAFFGVTYNEDYLFIGISVVDNNLSPLEEGHLFLDGDKSGGDYDDFDVHMKFSAMGVEILHGPPTLIPMLGFVPGLTGYTAEAAIPWADLGVTPEAGGQVGFDIILGDSDSLLGTQIDYYLAWNGGMENLTSTSSFGDLNFGVLSCGMISLYNGTIGDVMLRTPTDEPTTYVGTYEMFDNQNVVFRKDMQGAVTWGDTGFPTGTAVVDGDEIPATTGRYRVEFDCLSGEYTFTTEAAGDGVALAQYTQTAPTVDGTLDEYTLEYGSDLLVAGSGPNNNTVTWGAVWTEESIYIGAKVVDATVEGIGNPWDNDAIEFYFDGNHDSDGAYDGDFDTQAILDALNESTLWLKADGVQLAEEDYDAAWLATSDGYQVELRISWSGFGFYPGQGRTMGFSLGNNDSDNGIGRDYQTVWYGTENNWSNTAVLGDLQLAGGPYFFGIEEYENYNAFITVYPNPSRGDVNLQLVSDVFEGNVTVYVTDISGRTVETRTASADGRLIVLNSDNLTKGIYLINIIDESGKRAVKKLIVQ